MIDDDLATFGCTPPNSLPASFTIDFGREVKLSRLVFNQRLYNNRYYNHANLMYFDIYRPAVTTFSQSGFWNEWRKIKTCTVVKPSGLSGTETTNEDMRAAAKGHEFSFPRNMEPVRYVRIMMPAGSTWENASFANIAELTFYGIYE
jgi:hypothetical protein